jgi:alanine dehydrogenase
MIIGVPRETKRNEHRVGLNPFAVSRLVHQGHTVFLEHRAGEAAHFVDEDYQRSGGHTVYSTEEALRRADLVCRVGVLSTEELDLLKPGSIICGFHHLAVAPLDDVRRLMELEVTLISYELIGDGRGGLPVLSPFSAMAGQMAVHLAAYYLQKEARGRGILMGNVPGVPPPTVLVLGAGAVGYAAARQALVNGAHVIVLDEDLRKLTALSRRFSGQVVTVVAARDRLAQYTAIADVLIGAILIPGERAPFLVTESMVKAMKPGSVIVDVSIDQGGCVETSRPTTLDNPTFVAHDVVHYCVPNMTSSIARTSSRALANTALPYLLALADKGLDAALRDDPGLAEGVPLFRGKVVNEKVGRALDIPATPLSRTIRDGDAS